jgi:hypothetical protein
MSRRGATTIFLAAALALTAGALAPPVRAGGLDLPIGGPVTRSADPEDAPEPEVLPKLYDESIPAVSDSVIYVIDRSASMDLPTRPFTGLDGEPVLNGSRLDFVKCEIARSIRSLPPYFSFNVITFSHCVDSWQPGRVYVTAQAKADALAWVAAIEPQGWTNTGGATALALADRENKVVMLLSDGGPNYLDCAQTYVADYETHRRVIRSANTQGAVIHVFGIGLDPDTRGFMMSVAGENSGTFRELD